MMTIRKAALIGGSAAALVLLPAGVAVAATGNGPHSTGTSVSTCTNDQDRTQLRLHDGSQAGQGPQANDVGLYGYGYQSGPQDGTGPQAEQALDGTGNQWAEPAR